MAHNRLHSIVLASTLILICTLPTACKSSSAGGTTGGSSGGSAGGAAGGAVGGAVGGAAGGAGGGVVGGIPVPTEINVCIVDFSPKEAGTSNAPGMVWGKGIITFAVSVTCPKAQSRGSLDFAIFHTGTEGASLAGHQIASPSFPMAGVTTQTFTVPLPCEKGMWLFEYKWNGTISGASDQKQDANSGTGILLTSFNCK